MHTQTRPTEADEEHFARNTDTSAETPETAPDDGQAAFWQTVDRQFVPEMPVGWIAPSPHNPRRQFDAAALNELAESIRVDGVQQPIVVRPVNPKDWQIVPARGRATFVEAHYTGMFAVVRADDQYAEQTAVYNSRADAETAIPRFQIVMGERRWRASKLCERPTIPVIVRIDLSDRDALRLAVVENCKRTDLNPIEEADSYRALLDAGFKQAEIAEQVGVEPATISNALRLRKLPKAIRDMVIEKKLSGSHARALLRFDGFEAVQIALAEYTIANSESAKSLEKGVPHATMLEDAKLIKAFNPKNVTFDADRVCAACPFGALREVPGSWYSHVCLKPEHFAELTKAAGVEKEARLTRLREEMLAKQEVLKAQTKAATSPAALTEAVAVGALPAPLPDQPDGNESPLPTAPNHAHFRDLERDTYTEVDSSTKSKACTTDCPCRAQALDWSGKLVPICLQPGKYRYLQGQQTREDQKARKTHHATLWEAFMAERAERLWARDKLAHILMLWPGIATTPTDTRRKALASLSDDIDGELRALLSKPISARHSRDAFPLLFALPLETLHALALGCIFATEIVEAYEGRSDLTPKLDYYLKGNVAVETFPLSIEEKIAARAADACANDSEEDKAWIEDDLCSQCASSEIAAAVETAVAVL